MTTRYLWCDLETTGFDPDTHSIIEGAFILTRGPERRFELERQAETFFELPGDVVWSDEAREMHDASRLLADYAECQMARSPGWVSDYISSLWLAKYDDVRLAGRNPHFDRSFLDAHMPTLARNLHYRMFDVTTLLTIKPELDFGGVMPHRAMNDVLRDLMIARRFIGQ